MHDDRCAGMCRLPCTTWFEGQRGGMGGGHCTRTVQRDGEMQEMQVFLPPQLALASCTTDS